MKRGLVLGGGGLVGMGYHAGALKALDEWGADVRGADVIVGTSAGAILASYLSSGWTPSDFYDYAHGRHPDSERDVDRQREEVREIFVPLWSSPAERVRRSLGSFFVMASSRGYWRAGKKGRVPVAQLRRLFPAGMYSSERARERLHNDLPEKWPRDDVYICAADLYSGKRVPFGHVDAPEASFPDAVLASTAIPGVFPPVRIGDRSYVDGGIVSATSLDLAVEAGCEAIICVAPLGYRLEGALPVTEPRLWGPMILRAPFARSLRKEVKDGRSKGVHVLVVRPWVTELAALGTNAMRHYDRAAVVDAAREGTLRLLESVADHDALRAFAKTTIRKRAG